MTQSGMDSYPQCLKQTRFLYLNRRQGMKKILGIETRMPGYVSPLTN